MVGERKFSATDKNYKNETWRKYHKCNQCRQKFSVDICFSEERPTLEVRAYGNGSSLGHKPSCTHTDEDLKLHFKENNNLVALKKSWEKQRATAALKRRAMADGPNSNSNSRVTRTKMEPPLESLPKPEPEPEPEPEPKLKPKPRPKAKPKLKPKLKPKTKTKLKTGSATPVQHSIECQASLIEIDAAIHNHSPLSIGNYIFMHKDKCIDGFEENISSPIEVAREITNLFAIQ